MRYSTLGYWGGGIGGTALASIGAVAVFYGVPGGPSWLKAGAMSAFIILGFAICLVSWRYADEVLMHEHKTAWWWGSLSATALLGPIIIVVGFHLVTVPQIFGPTDVGYFVEGMFLLLTLQLLGDVVVLVVRKLVQKPQ